MSPGTAALRGEMGSVAAVAREIARAGVVEEALAWTRRGLAHVAEAGESRVLARLSEACQPVESTARRIADARAQAGRVLSEYADRVAGLQYEARRLRAQGEEAEAQRAAAVRRLWALESEGDASAGQIRAAEARRDEAVHMLRRTADTLTNLDAARAAADARCVAGLRASVQSLDGLAGLGRGGHGRGGLFAAAFLAIGRKPPSDADIDQILAGTLSATEVLRLWRRLGRTPKEVRALPPGALYALANTNGLPATVRDAASRALIDIALERPAEVYRLLGFGPASGSAISIVDFIGQVEELKAAVGDAEWRALLLPGEPLVQVVGFGHHDGAFTSAISLGNLDTASNVAVNVSGMNSAPEARAGSTSLDR